MYNNKWNLIYNYTKEDTEKKNFEWKSIKNINTIVNLLTEIKFIDNSFIEQIKEFSLYECKINNYITIYNSKPTYNKLYELLFIYNFVYNLSKKPFSNVKVYLIPLNLPKKISVPLLTTKNFNSGVCFSTSNTREIIIWRDEEITKVLTHELIHAHRLDFTNLNVNHFLNGFNINKKSYISPNEAITETMTIITISFINGKFFNKDPYKILLKELEWSFQQMIKIAKNIDFTDIYQESDIISYFFIKGFFLFYLVQINNLDLFFSKTKITDKTITNVIDKMSAILKNKNNYLKMYDYIKSIKKIKTDTLRMSRFSI